MVQMSARSMISTSALAFWGSIMFISPTVSPGRMVASSM
jgi:hypothetical protein